VTLGSSSRDGEIEAFVVDRYLDSLLAREPRDPGDIPADLLATADRLATGLPRYHPSFRFEEALAAHLAAAAVGRTDPGEVIALPVVPPATANGDTPDGRSPQVRPVVIGGVLTSAAISLAGAAWVAWRRGRPGPDPMRRVVRAVARARVV
jgi:hypothetical protein